PAAALATEATEPPEIVRTRHKHDKGPGTSPAAQPVLNPDLGGVDPMIAVGKDYVIVTEDHDIEFLNKTGEKAGAQLDPLKGGGPTHISSSSFFSAFTANKNSDGTVNRNNINRHLRLPPDSAFDKRCDPGDTAMPQPCINEFYDTRVTYDPYRER